jgi:uncharacterized membrane protein
MRRPWIDWLRGLAVVIMFHAHTIDSWTLASDRTSWWYYQSVRVSGMAAPLFLFLAGLAVVMASNAQVRKGATRAAASWALQKRGWEILGLAILFRAQSWIFNPGATFTGLLKIDILNVMGPSMVAAAWLWGRSGRDVVRLAICGLGACAVVAATPLVRETAVLAALPDSLEWYLRPPAGKGWFALFPWSALLLAGAAVGEIIDRARDAASERRLAGVFAVAGAATFAAGLTASYFPPLIPGTSFWTTSLSYFVIRIGLMLFLLSLAYAWMARPSADPATSPMVQMGRTSLFLYWVHVELAYGVTSYPIKGKVPFWAAMVGFVAFTLFMLWLSYAKDALVARWKASSPSPAGVARA